MPANSWSASPRRKSATTSVSSASGARRASWGRCGWSLGALRSLCAVEATPGPTLGELTPGAAEAFQASLQGLGLRVARGVERQGVGFAQQRGPLIPRHAPGQPRIGRRPTGVFPQHPGLHRRDRQAVAGVTLTAARPDLRPVFVTGQFLGLGQVIGVLRWRKNQSRRSLGQPAVLRPQSVVPVLVDENAGLPGRVCRRIRSRPHDRRAFPHTLDGSRVLAGRIHAHIRPARDGFPVGGPCSQHERVALDCR